MELTSGFAGAILHIDLTSGKIEKMPVTESMVEDSLGGMGFSARILYDQLAPNTDSLSPDNLFIYAAGILAGTLIPGSCRTEITFKSPLSGFFGDSNSAAPAQMLKWAGYDNLVVSGKSEKPVYIKIDDDNVSIEDASHLWGKDNYRTVDILWDEFPGCWVSSIGPAGENLVRFANVLNNKTSSFGRTGVGTIMGAKKVKAIAVRGSRPVRVADPPAFMRLVRRITDDLMVQPHVYGWRELGTLIQFQDFAPGSRETLDAHGSEHLDMGDWTRYYKENIKSGLHTCHVCPVGCKAQINIKEGKHKGLDFNISCSAGTLTLPFLGILQLPYEEVPKFSEICNRLGLDTLEATSMLLFATHCFENEVITTEDTGGLQFHKGFADEYAELLVNIADRKGLGDVLADGVVTAAQRLGEGARPFSGNIKGWRMEKEEFLRWSTVTFGPAVNPRGPQLNQYSSITHMPERSEESLLRYVNRIGVPREEIKKVVTGGPDGFDVPLMTYYVEMFNNIVYAMSMCNRPFFSRVIDLNTFAELFRTSVGLDYSPQKLMNIAERIINIKRMFNVRDGATREDDCYPQGHLPPEREEEFQGFLDSYYLAHGWDKKTGIPTPAKLEELSLEDPLNR
jgi:aldehyde:ferredoxin oxidoreductase